MTKADLASKVAESGMTKKDAGSIHAAFTIIYK